MIGVLKLINHNMHVARLILVQDFRAVAKEVRYFHNQVVEVQGIALGEKLLVALIYPRYYLLIIVANQRTVVLRGEEPGLGRGNRRRHATRGILLGIKPYLLDAALQQAELVTRIIDNEAPVHPDMLRLYAEQTGTGSMKRAQGQPIHHLP